MSAAVGTPGASDAARRRAWLWRGSRSTVSTVWRRWGVMLSLAIVGTSCVAGPVAARGLLDFSAEELQAIARHGPWSPRPARDPGNALSGDPVAAELGRRLFFDPALSPSGRVACASCHVPSLGFADGRARAVGLEALDRHAPGLWNAVGERWMGWGGANDSLWSQALQALLDPREMGASAAHVRQRLTADPELGCRAGRLRARLIRPAGVGEIDDPADLVLAAKALGAFVATLQSPRTPFDDFRDALLRGDRRSAARYPLAAQRGLRLFIGRGRCTLCHGGPRFSNGEFADIGLPFFVRPGVVDPGRHAGIEALRASPYNLLSGWADAGESLQDLKTRHVMLQPRNFGEFKVPSLRHVAHTAPYMHDGQLATLADVIRHYDTLDEERLHADGERILQPLRLAPGEADDLEAFLRSLGGPQPPVWRPAPERGCR